MSLPHAGRFSGVVRTVLAGFCVLASLEPASAQHPRSDTLRMVQSVVPRSGPIGTTVKLHTLNLPIQAKIYVGVGATHDGWEELAEVAQGELGEVSATVAIPEFATWEKPLVFIVFNGVFSPIAISEPFHVTDGEGRIRRRGTITEEGVGCTTLRDEDDNRYMLSGDVQGVSPGDPVVVEGVYTESGPCTEGDAIQVTRLSRDP